MGVIVASLLLFCDEEIAFWILTTLIEDLLPANYFSQNLLGLQVSFPVVRTPAAKFLPNFVAVF